MLFDGGKCGLKMKQLPFMGVVCTVMLFIVYRTTNYQYKQAEIDRETHPFSSEIVVPSRELNNLPRGMLRTKTDLEFRPLWSTSSSRLQVNDYSHRNLLAIPVGIEQKDNVDTIVQKFLPENFTIILFHYDGNVDEWRDLEWSNEAIHIVAENQTKWWFAKRFLHPDVVSIYDYIFLWDEDLGVEHFHPGRYLKIVREAGLEISQPALDPNSTDIHHRITIRARTKKFHRRVYDRRGSTKCYESSEGPPCTGYVEGMAPVFSRSAWRCTWNLIQNDLVHGWGMDMKLGYCAQGDRTEKVGVVDSQYVLHMAIQTLGSSPRKASHSDDSTKHGAAADKRAQVRKQSTWEQEAFEKRWEKAAKEDKNWVDPFRTTSRSRARTQTQTQRRNHH